MTPAEIRAEGRRLHKIAEEAGALGERGAASTFKRHLGEFVFNNAAVLLAEPGEQEAMRAQGRREGEAAGFSRGIEEAAAFCESSAEKMEPTVVRATCVQLSIAIRALAASTAQGEMKP